MPPNEIADGQPEPDCFFVYGTLRPDDTSGASWTRSFTRGMTGTPSILRNARLYVDQYPVAVQEDDCPGSVRGWILWPSDKELWNAKVCQADEIEGAPDLYHRIPVTVQTDEGASRTAWMYTRAAFPRLKEVPGGDWVAWRQSASRM